MCCCGKPNVNGQPGYSWDGKTFGIRPIAAPALQEGDEMLCDEPGRCGGVDAHSHHFRMVKAQYGGFFLLVRHGGGDERIALGYRTFIHGALSSFDSNGRYWLLHSIYHMHNDAVRAVAEKTAATWRKAAAEKRIKTRKYPAKGTVKVWIEPAQQPEVA